MTPRTRRSLGTAAHTARPQMKPTRLLLAIVLALPLGLVLLRTALAYEPVVVALLPPPDAAFKEKFKKLMEKPQKAEMEKLVKAESSNASAWIARANEILAERPDDPDMRPYLTELSATWKAAMKSSFPEKEAEFFASLTGQNKKDRSDLRKRFDEARSDFDGNAEKKDANVYVPLVDELALLGSSFDQVGDHYYASEAWLMFAACLDENLRGGGADFKRAATGLLNALDERAKVDLADAKKDEAEKRRAALIAKGGDKGGGIPGRNDANDGPTDAGATIVVPLTFEIVPNVEVYQRPAYNADDFYLVWRSIPLKGKNSNARFETLGDAPALYRLGSSDVRFDSDGDGKGDGPADEKVPLTGNVTPIKINLGKGNAARPWAFLAAIGATKDNYQGIEMNMAPSDEQMSLYTFNASSVVGTLDTQPIRIIDDSMDGMYGSVPQSYGFAGLTKNNYQPEMDCIVVGSSKRARPWSEFNEVNGKWWKFEMASSGQSIKASPVKTETGTLKLENKGPIAPTWFVVRGANMLKDSFFDLAEAGAKGVQVPVGRYTIYYGELRKGKKRQMQKCLILPAKNVTNYDVTKGGTTVITIGAPYTLDFTYKNEDGKLTVTGQSVVVVGTQGERYERPWGCVTHPEAGWRKKGTKKASRYDKMQHVLDNDGIVKLGWESAWFPLDIELDAKGQGEVEVQLVDKKHELFGKIESDWK